MLVSNFWFIGMKIISYLLFQLKRLQYLHERSFFSRELLLWVRTNVLLCDSLQVQVIIWPWDIFWPNNAIHQFTSCSSKWKKNLAQKWFLVYLCLNRNLLSCKGCCWAVVYFAFLFFNETVSLRQGLVFAIAKSKKIYKYKFCQMQIRFWPSTIFQIEKISCDWSKDQ